MERLTRRSITGEADCAYCNGDHTPDGKGCSPRCELWNKQMEKLASYEEAEEQGLLLRLPCRVGDKVYKLWNCGKNGKSVAEFEVRHIDIDFLPEIEFYVISTKNKSNSYWFCKASDLGKTVFLTRAEAEKALEEMG